LYILGRFPPPPPLGSHICIKQWHDGVKFRQCNLHKRWNKYTCQEVKPPLLKRNNVQDNFLPEGYHIYGLQWRWIFEKREVTLRRRKLHALTTSFISWNDCSERVSPPAAAVLLAAAQLLDECWDVPLAPCRSVCLSVHIQFITLLSFLHYLVLLSNNVEWTDSTEISEKSCRGST
jgi:hypothetical protein